MLIQEPFKLVLLATSLQSPINSDKLSYSFYLKLLHEADITITYYDILSRNKTSRSFYTKQLAFNLTYTDTIQAEYFILSISDTQVYNTGSWKLLKENQLQVTNTISLSNTTALSLVIDLV